MLSRIFNTQVDATPDSPQPFGYKMAWLAIKSEKTCQIMESLAIRSPRPSNWRSGVDKAYANCKNVFVSPSVAGWTFVMSKRLPVPDVAPHNSSKWGVIIAGLSREFGEAQIFATHRVVEFHGWARSVDGAMPRAFFYLGERGEVIVNDGEQPAHERALGLPCLGGSTLEAATGIFFDESRFPKEDDVFAMAGHWSLDPTRLDKVDAPPAVGILGKVQRFW